MFKYTINCHKVLIYCDILEHQGTMKVMNATIIDSQNKQICDRIRPLLTWHFCAKKTKLQEAGKVTVFFTSIFLFGTNIPWHLYFCIILLIKPNYFKKQRLHHRFYFYWIQVSANDDDKRCFLKWFGFSVKILPIKIFFQ